MAALEKIVTMRPWNKEALNSMRHELGGVNMGVVMIKKLEKLGVHSPDNLGFLSRVQLQEVESEKTPAGKMNKVIDYLLEMEDEYFADFCEILKQGGFTGKVKMLREKAEDLRKSVKYQFPFSLEELSVSSPKTEVSSLQAEGGSDPPGREDLLDDEAALKRLCWIPFDIKTISIEAKGGILCLEPQSDDIQVAKEDTVFVEVPPGAVSTSADVKMRYAVIPSGSFTLPEGYQFGSPVVYIYYDGQRVTNSLVLHLPNCYGGENHAKDGLSFAVAPHSCKGSSMYDFQLLSGGKFPVSSRYGVVEIGGHCSLFAVVFKLETCVYYQAVCLKKVEEHETVYDIAVTYAIPSWLKILQTYRPDWKLIKSCPFQFTSDRITATLTQCRHDNSHAVFRGPSELLSCHVQYNCHGITSPELLEMAVNVSSYPPSITCVVTYNEELRGTGRPTEVGLHISGMEPEMEFQCTTYEQIQVAPPPYSSGPAFAPPPYSLGPAQTETTSQPHPSIPLREAGPAPPPYSLGPAYAQEDDRIAETPPQSEDESNGSSEESSLGIN